MGGSNSSSPSSSSRKRSYTSTDSAVVVDAAQRLEEAPATRPDETDYSGGNIPAPDTVRQNSSKAPAVHCEVVILPPKDGLVPQKRRKLTVGEKEELKAMKEAKARARMDERVRGEEKRKSGEEERQRKLEERRGKAEERRKQDEEKRARADDRRRLEELKRREKEAEKQQREDERLKKERSQKKLSSFFTMPELKRTEKLSSEPATSVKEIEGSKSLITNSNPRATSDYDEFFLPFAPLSYSSVASHNNLSRIDSIDSFVKLLDEHAGQSPHIDDEEAKGSRPVMDPSHYELSDYISQASTIHRIGPSCNRQTSPSQGSAVGVQNIKSGRHGAVEEAGSLKLSVKAGDEHAERLPSDKFRATTIKYLHFSEDVRPPYVGTYTKLTTMSMLKLRRNPFRRGLSEVDYNYDSETEWAEPDEDGEDLGSDCGDDEEGEGEIESGDEMSEFLDDEGVDAVAGTAGRRALAKSEMEPYCTGLCWEDSRGLFEESTEKRIEVMDQLNFPALQLGLLLDGLSTPIDPFSTAYWPSSGPQSLQFEVITPIPTKIRLPLHSLGGNIVNGREARLISSSASTVTTGTIARSSNQCTGKNGIKRMVPSDLLGAFKTAISGSDLTKVGLVEELKRKFPKVPKDAIHNTIGVVAIREGVREVDKRWKITQ